MSNQTRAFIRGWNEAVETVAKAIESNADHCGEKTCAHLAEVARQHHTPLPSESDPRP